MIADTSAVLEELVSLVSALVRRVEVLEAQLAESQTVRVKSVESLGVGLTD